MQHFLPGHDACLPRLRRRELDCLQAQDAQPHAPLQARARAAGGAAAGAPAHRPRRLPPLSPRGAPHPALPPQLAASFRGADSTGHASPARACGTAADFAAPPPPRRAAAAWGFGALGPRRAASDGAEAAARSAPGRLAAGAVAAPHSAGGRGLRRVASEDFSFCVPAPDRLEARALMGARARREPMRPGSGPAGDPRLPAARRRPQGAAPCAAADERAGPPWLAAGPGAGADAAARLTALLAFGEGAAGSCAGSEVGCTQGSSEAAEAAAAGAAPCHVSARESLARFSEIIARSAGGAAGADAAPSTDRAPGRDPAGAPGGDAARGEQQAGLAALAAAPGGAAPGGAVARQALPSPGAPPCGVTGSGAAHRGDAGEEAAGEGAPPEGASAGWHGRAAPVVSLVCRFEAEPGGGGARQAKPARAGAPSGQAPGAAGPSPQSSADSCTAVPATLADTAAMAGPYPGPAPEPAPGARARGSAAPASARPAPGALPPGLHGQPGASAQARARWLARVSPGAPFGSNISLPGSALGSPAGSTADSKHSGGPASEQSTATRSARARHSSEGGDSDPGDVWSTALSGAGAAGPPAQAHIDESCLGAHVTLAAFDAGSSDEPKDGGAAAAEQSGGDAAAAPAPAGGARSGGCGGGGADGDGSDCDSVALGWEAESACSRISGDGWGPGASPATLARVGALPRWRADAADAAVDRLILGPGRLALL